MCGNRRLLRFVRQAARARSRRQYRTLQRFTSRRTGRKRRLSASSPIREITRSSAEIPPDKKISLPIRGAIASKHSYARIINPHESEWGYRTEINDRNSGGLVALSVAELLERHSDCQPFICKIDIEGAEQELFSANTQWLERFPIVIIELHDWLFPRSGNSAQFSARDRRDEPRLHPERREHFFGRPPDGYPRTDRSERYPGASRYRHLVDQYQV